MPLVGYRNLQWLKSRLLPAEMGDEPDHDADVTAIGLGVASLFDRFTGRQLRRTEGHVFGTRADQDEVVVDCYPIEEITGVHLVVNGQAHDIATSVRGTQMKAGIVRFHGAPGSEADLIRLTLTGGFWCEDADEDDDPPVGSVVLPEELLLAWVLQCRAVAEAENTFRAKGAEKPDKKTGGAVNFESLDLLPMVRRTLQLYMRMG